MGRTTGTNTAFSDLDGEDNRKKHIAFSDLDGEDNRKKHIAFSDLDGEDNRKKQHFLTWMGRTTGTHTAFSDLDGENNSRRKKHHVFSDLDSVFFLAWTGLRQREHICSCFICTLSQFCIAL